MARRTSSNAQLLRGTLELLLLEALSRGPLHGYAIARKIEAATGDALSVEEGSMYPALYRLEEHGCITARWAVNDGGRRMRVYALTPTGRKRLTSHRKDWTAFVRAVTRMVGAPR